jgi:plasmid stabilization system protein ParE
MARQITWSQLARTDFISILEYLSIEWNPKVVSRFINETDTLIRPISRHPSQFPLINKSLNVRKCVISRQNTIYYRASGSTIEIIRIFDSRQDPDKLKFL